MSKLPGIGGGGGGTDAITAKSSAKSLKKRVGDVGKVLTRPFHKVKKILQKNLLLKVLLH